MPYRRFCRIATMVFLLFTVYPLAVKLVEHRLAHDWLHSMLHLGSAALAGYAGWLARSLTPAILYTWFIGVFYTALGVVGWFIDGLLLETHLAIPLGPVDNIFHLGVGGAALTVALIARSRSGDRG
ncbi:hypothetical protein Rhe02_43520 [Rhizocola hellebori]|uniref:DUF4383 domain-containing protein n=1 Tax=Rhizocola hellebori TaxID=1392758 RepID=A0A8J3Q9A3_9ACTN|nr:hypothetical protein [Rhizocola hellebori]GIH06285.1 hypothetical protein Rhe02_43520 [Rhizocola hellebori]